ncbi:MAG: phosphate ABC transporter substrate-binding protein PstS [Bdellovibrio sp.]|nr:MAG: phosphate ABC transporter substrate-binding protein PstS [Bdellovibrio sp.]
MLAKFILIGGVLMSQVLHFCIVFGVWASLASTQASVLVNGAGSTFAEPIYSKWFTEYQKNEKGFKFNYQGTGSGAGIKQMIAGTVDFAGTDDPMSKEDIAKTGPVIHVPIAMGAVVVSYNLAGVEKPLQLTGEVVAKIFNGQIKKWSDPALVALNNGVKFPNSDIIVVTRSDSSGTTAVFSDYLAKVSPAWQGKNGKTVEWFKGSVGQRGNTGVAGYIRQTPGAIGYVELVYAKQTGLPFAAIQNKKGQMILASVESVSESAQGVTEEMVKNGFKLSLTNSPRDNAYPISAFTWMLVYETLPKGKGEGVLNFAKWAIKDEAQAMAAKINYASVPKPIRDEVAKALAKVKLK